jgi:hypothetical protein
MLIEVTQEHIKAGKEGDCNYCPIALALNEATGRLWVVNNYYVYERDEYNNQISEKILFNNHNCRITDWIFAFDKDGKAKPFSFNLET